MNVFAVKAQGQNLDAVSFGARRRIQKVFLLFSMILQFKIVTSLAIVFFFKCLSMLEISSYHDPADLLLVHKAALNTLSLIPVERNPSLP